MENNLENINSILIDFVPLHKIRNNGIGDFFTQLDRGVVRAVKLPDIRYSILIALHEILEFVLTSNANIKESDIDKFDAIVELNGSESDKIDPGSLPNAPYKRQHLFSENIERLVALEMGIDFKEYNQVIDNLH